MHVNYNPELVGLIREVRHLALLGYKIPVAIREAADLAKQFMRQAKSLQQVINLKKIKFCQQLKFFLISGII